VWETAERAVPRHCNAQLSKLRVGVFLRKGATSSFHHSIALRGTNIETRRRRMCR